jgi:hypothetical protein
LLESNDFPELAQAAAEAIVACGYGDEVAGKLLEIAQGAAKSGLDPDTSLRALHEWTEKRGANGDELAATTAAAYDALAPPLGIPPTTEEDRERRTARLQLFADALPKLLANSNP